MCVCARVCTYVDMEEGTGQQCQHRRLMCGKTVEGRGGQEAIDMDCEFWTFFGETKVWNSYLTKKRSLGFGGVNGLKKKNL